MSNKIVDVFTEDAKKKKISALKGTGKFDEKFLKKLTDKELNDAYIRIAQYPAFRAAIQ